MSLFDFGRRLQWEHVDGTMVTRNAEKDYVDFSRRSTVHKKISTLVGDIEIVSDPSIPRGSIALRGSDGKLLLVWNLKEASDDPLR